jgi:hypothetical protein
VLICKYDHTISTVTALVMSTELPALSLKNWLSKHGGGFNTRVRFSEGNTCYLLISCLNVTVLLILARSIAVPKANSAHSLPPSHVWISHRCLGTHTGGHRNCLLSLRLSYNPATCSAGSGELFGHIGDHLQYTLVRTPMDQHVYHISLDNIR